VTPEAADGGAIAKICDGDTIRLDAVSGRLEVIVDAAEWASRRLAIADLSGNDVGVGRELFVPFRSQVNRADEGATIFRVN
jgi:phosphogluconate dehydratase